MDIDFDELDNSGTVDVCPSCGTLLAHDMINESCNDPMGCGDFVSDELDEDDNEENLLEELNFD